jgi:hypothetical protein
MNKNKKNIKIAKIIEKTFFWIFFFFLQKLGYDTFGVGYYEY